VIGALVARLVPFQWWLVGGAAALAVTTIGVQQLRVAHLKTTLADCHSAHDAAVARASQAALELSEAYRTEEQRRATAAKEIQDDAQLKIAAARADAAAADAATSRLRVRIAATVAAARAAAGRPAPARGSAPAGDPIGMLADVLGRADARAGRLARIADQRGAAGAACERAYNSLTGSP
jgi:hypothetical protein